MTLRVQRGVIPGGDAGARATIYRMAQLTRRASSHPAVRALAIQLVQSINGRDYSTQIAAIREWAASHIRFLRDPRGTELLHDPVLIVQLTQRDGVAYVDCDDAAMVTATLGTAIGLKARFVTVAFLDKRAPYAHVFSELAAPVGSPRWYEQDVTREVEELPVHLFSRSFVVDV